MADIDAMALPEAELPSDLKLLYAALNALAVVCSSHEEFRKKIFEQNNHKSIIELLKHAEPRIRSGACLCIISLARAKKFLKNMLITEGIVNLLNKLLFDKYLEVRVNATSAICNVSLEFQSQICENSECIKRLVELTQSKNVSLRYKAIFAIKNIVFKTTPELKKSVISQLSYERLFDLLNDEETMIQEQAMCAFRNIMHEKPEWIQHVLDKVGTEVLLKRIEEKLLCPNASLISQAIYLLCNIASGDEKQKNMLMESVVAKHVVSLLVTNTIIYIFRVISRNK
jgi:hypothetical protein